jgi:hypothetical protein
VINSMRGEDTGRLAAPASQPACASVEAGSPWISLAVPRRVS